jgi:hypothetical protein
MKNQYRLLAVACAAIGLVALGTLTEAAETDLSWVAKLPGLTGGVQNKEGGEIKIVYSFTGSSEDTMDLLFAGLEQRGWTVQRNSVVAALGISSIESAKARKGTARLNIAVMGTTGARSLALRLLGGTTSSPSSSGGRATVKSRDDGSAVISEEGSGSVSLGADGSVVIRDASGDTVSARGGKIHARDASGESVTIDASGVVAGESGSNRKKIGVSGNDTVRKITCEGGEVIAVSGNDNQVTLKGACGILYMSGNDNSATVLGSIEKINLSGSENSVGWDPAASPRAPVIVKSGVENRVYRLSE